MRFFFPIFLFLILPQGNATDVLKIGISDSHKEVFNTNGQELIGPATKTFQCVLENTEFPYKLMMMPHARLQKQLISGGVDIGMPLAQSLPRDEGALFSEGVTEVEFYLVFEPKYQFYELYKFPLATVRTGKKKSELGLENFILFEVNNWESAIAMLKKQRVSSLRIPKPIYQQYKTELSEYNRRYFNSEKIGLYVSKSFSKREQLLKSLNRSIRQCRLN